MTIERFLKVIPPMAAPDEPFDGPWEPIEAEIGTPLPRDYKDFCRLFGLGEIMEFLTVFIPKCRSPYVRLEHEVRAVYDCFVGYEELP